MKWSDLKDLKDLYPLDISDYAVANKVNELTSFKCRVKDTLRTQDRIILRMEKLGIYADATGQGGVKKRQ